MPESSDMLIQVNGKEQKVLQGTTLLQIVQAMGVDPARVVVERNLEIVDPEKLSETRVAGSDRIEVIHFVGGG